MNPSQLSAELKRIASAIENSKSPSKELVAKDIQRVISKIAAGGLEVTLTDDLLKNANFVRSGVDSDKIQAAFKSVLDTHPGCEPALKALVDAFARLSSWDQPEGH